MPLTRIIAERAYGNIGQATAERGAELNGLLQLTRTRRTFQCLISTEKALVDFMPSVSRPANACGSRPLGRRRAAAGVGATPHNLRQSASFQELYFQVPT